MASRHLVLPYSLATNDAKFLRGGLATASDFFEFLRDSVETLCAEPDAKMLSVGLHLRVAGHPGRAAGLRRFLEYGPWPRRSVDLPPLGHRTALAGRAPLPPLRRSKQENHHNRV